MSFFDLPLTPEQRRIRALMAGDPRANFAGFAQKQQDDLLNNPTVFNSNRTDNPGKQIAGTTPLITPNLQQNENYKVALRNRLQQISGYGTEETFAKQQAALNNFNPGGAVLGKNTPKGWIGDMSGNDRRDMVLRAAASMAGTPYSWGGGNSKGASYGVPYKGKGSENVYGFDCSGLVQYAFAQAGFNMPRHGASQRAMGQKTSIRNLRPGDLVGKPGHVAIYAGNGMMWESPTFGKHVRLVPVRSGMFGIRISY